MLYAENHIRGCSILLQNAVYSCPDIQCLRIGDDVGGDDGRTPWCPPVWTFAHGELGLG